MWVVWVLKVMIGVDLHKCFRNSNKEKKVGSSISYEIYLNSEICLLDNNEHLKYPIRCLYMKHVFIKFTQ